MLKRILFCGLRAGIQYPINSVFLLPYTLMHERSNCLDYFIRCLIKELLGHCESLQKGVNVTEWFPYLNLRYEIVVSQW